LTPLYEQKRKKKMVQQDKISMEQNKEKELGEGEDFVWT